MQTTIEFRGMQATYTFPVGVTTLWWYAPNQGHSLKDADAARVSFGNATVETVAFEDAPADGPVFGEDTGAQRPFFRFDRERA